MTKNDYDQIKNIAHRRRMARQDQAFMDAFGMPTEAEKEPPMSATDQAKRDVGLHDPPPKTRRIPWMDIVLSQSRQYQGYKGYN